jgi:hypothetical protein
MVTSKVNIFAVAIVFSRKLFIQVLDQTAPTADCVDLSDHRRGRSWHELNCVLPATEDLRGIRNVQVYRYKHAGPLALQDIVAKCQQPFVKMKCNRWFPVLCEDDKIYANESKSTIQPRERHPEIIKIQDNMFR